MASTVKELMEEGFTALERSQLRKAIKIGKKLLGLRHSSGYEIIAKAEWALEKREKAVRTLEEGVAAVPSVGPLWELLGCYLSDLERYEDAHAAFERALGANHDKPSSVHNNFAILLMRQRKWREALDLLQTVEPGEDPVLAVELRTSRVMTLNELERFGEAAAEATAALESFPSCGDDGEDERKAGLRAERGVARWCGDRDRAGATADALEALQLHRGCSRALWLLREIEGKPSPAGRYFRIRVRGRWHVPIEEGKAAPSFYTTYDVVADSAEEALDLARRFETPEVRAGLEIEEVEDLEARPEDPKGVYRLTGRIFWSPDE